MSIKLRFALLLGLLLLIFLGSLAALRLLEKEQLTEALASSQRDAGEMLERWLDLNGSSLRQFAEDYSRWDDMVRFVETRDTAWAAVNLRESLATFKTHALWVLDRNGEVIYRAHDGEDVPLPMSAAEWKKLTATDPFPHFFMEHDHDLLEVRAAPVQPSDDSDRRTPAQGWLLVARLWNREHLDALGRLTDSALRIAAPGQAPALSSSESRLTLIRPLDDWQGRPLSTLYVTRTMPAIAQRLRTDVFEARVFIIFGLLVMGALGLCLHGWVLRPLNAIRDSLDAQNPAPLQPLLRQGDELSRIARRLAVSYAQQEELRRETEERARLGRDLHDGIIQSIYAAGMGLAAARTRIATHPAEAAESVDQIRAALNETIRDVRNFITGLEPEALQAQTFTSAVAGIFEFFKAGAQVSGELDIDESAAGRLHLACRTAALHVVRECTSNAVRHGRAARVRVSLRLDKNGRAARLSIEDDGCGFDPATVRRGRGLDNIAERARNLGATADIDSRPGKGTRAVIVFPITDSAA